MVHAACYQAFGRDFFVEPASAQHANAVFHDEYELEQLRSHNVRTILDVGAHVGSFTVLCHEYWPDAKIVSVEPHPESFELLQRNTVHIPSKTLRCIQAAVTPEGRRALLASSVSHSRVGEYAASVWDELSPRAQSFGIKVPAITPAELWQRASEFLGPEIDLLKLDCDGAEYLILSDWSASGHLFNIGWIRGEWHHRPSNPELADSLVASHDFHIDPNQPHEVGLFVAHRR